VASLTIGGRPDYWPARAAHLAGLVSADALAIVVVGVQGVRVAFAQHNLPKPSPSADIDARPLPIQLADGRLARDRLVVPLIWNDRVVGSVVGLRVDRPWGPESLGLLTRSAALIAVDRDDPPSVSYNHLTLQTH